ncbi:MAG: periplasmic divalent cation tolerance protein [Sphingomonadales bacterium]|nr:periplasmic divalent cation tolerance protein [Sphingomonadales bacterium]
MSGIVTVYATFASEEEARRIGRTCVEERIAACVNLLGAVHSIYRWEGKIEEAGEAAALFKTTETGAPKLLARIAELHSYDVPAAVVWPIADALGAYRTWVEEGVRAAGESGDG